LLSVVFYPLVICQISAQEIIVTDDPQFAQAGGPPPTSPVPMEPQDLNYRHIQYSSREAKQGPSDRVLYASGPLVQIDGFTLRKIHSLAAPLPLHMGPILLFLASRLAKESQDGMTDKPLIGAFRMHRTHHTHRLPRSSISSTQLSIITRPTGRPCREWKTHRRSRLRTPIMPTRWRAGADTNMGTLMWTWESHNCSSEHNFCRFGRDDMPTSGYTRL